VDPLPVFAEINALALNHIVYESALEELAVRET
jgi:hypothetical protein